MKAVALDTPVVTVDLDVMEDFDPPSGDVFRGAQYHGRRRPIWRDMSRACQASAFRAG